MYFYIIYMYILLKSIKKITVFKFNINVSVNKFDYIRDIVHC